MTSTPRRAYHEHMMFLGPLEREEDAYWCARMSHDKTIGVEAGEVCGLPHV
jgi:hypothetical protein